MTNQSRDGLVSVIIPTYNREKTIGRAIRSVLAQTYENLELIVVDDGSTDNTCSIVEKFDDPRLRYVPFAQNRGASAARNEGLRLATGEFIAFQDSDDEWLCDKIEAQIDAARQLGAGPVAVFHMKVVYGRDENRVYGNGRVCCVPIIPDGGSQEDYIKLTHERNLMSPQTLLFSRSCLSEVGGFDPLLKNSVDWDFSLRLVYAARVCFIAEPLVMTYIQPDSISTIKKSAARSQLRILLKMGRYSDVDRKVLGEHFGRVGMSLHRLGKPKSARKLLRRSVSLSPTPTNIARLVVNALPVGFSGRR
jgi:glycosyltransferase involved in cell wall biosynthesis